MRVTIVREDNRVIVDGVGADVCCVELPSYVRAIQWDGVGGWTEFSRDAAGIQPGNLPLSSIEPYRFLIDRWRLRRAEDALAEKQLNVDRKEKEIEAARLQREHEANQTKAIVAFREEQAAREAERVSIGERLAAIEATNRDLAARLETAERKLGEMSDAAPE